MNEPLELPIVIPQQRPGSQERGFMAAYAPCLQSCGIDQDTFLHFIADCNKAVQGSKVLAGVQVVSFGVGFTPEVIVMGVAAAVQVGAGAANKGFVRHKTNTILDKYNDELFGPRGLQCMIMKYEPQAEGSLSAPTDSRPQSANPLMSSVVSLVTGGRGSGPRLQDPISGTAQGANALPTAVAPLLYMDDRRHLQGSISPDSPAAIPSSGRSKAKGWMNSVNDYFDRRARAQYAAENNGDILNVPLSRPFSNRYLDPNHAASNNGLMGLLSGGAVKKDPQQRKRREEHKIAEDERKALEDYREEVEKIRNDNKSRRETDEELRKSEEEYKKRMAEFRDKKQEVEAGERKIKKNILFLVIANRA